MTEAQGPLPENPRKLSVPGPLSKAKASEEDEEFWDLDREDAMDELPSDSEGDAAKASAAPFAKGDAPEVVQKPRFSLTPLEPREIKVEAPLMVQTDVPHDAKSGKPSREVVLSSVDDAFAALEAGEVEEAPVESPQPVEQVVEPELEPELEQVVEPEQPVEQSADEVPVFAIGEAPPVPSESGDSEKPVGFAEETAGAEGKSARVLDLPKILREWTSGFSWLEKASMLAVMVLVTGFAVLLFFPAIGSLPDEKERARAEDFPKQGKHVIVKSALTYWREPIEEGPNADVFKRGTALLPAIDMEVEGGPAVLRILFRGEDGVVVGDSVTREVNGKQVVKIAGTEGFLELGLHAAYRTGQTKPWMVQVYEAKPGSGEIQDFVLIFEMDMSAFLQ